MSSVKKSAPLLKEKDYNNAVDQESKFFHVDSFSLLLLPNKETALTKIGGFFNATYESLTKPMLMEEIIQMKKSIQPRVFLFNHYLPDGKELQPVKKLAKECRIRNIISILDVSKSVQKIAPVLFQTDIVVCERKNYCVLILNEGFLKDTPGLLFRKQLLDDTILQKA